MESQIARWNVEDVYNFVKKINPIIAQKLKDEDYNGMSLEALCSLEANNEEWTHLGIKSGTRVTLQSEIKKLQNQPHTNPLDIIPLDDHAGELLFERLKGALSFKQMMLSNGISSIIYHLPSDIIAGAQRGLSFSLSNSIFQGTTAALQVHDLIIAPAILLVQTGINIGRWYCGDITANQARKNMIVNAVAITGGALGTWAGVAAATAIGAAAGTVVGPIGTVVGGILGALVGAIIGCVIAGAISEKISPDGPLEEFIIKRNEMLESLKQLNCTESSSDEDIRRAYKLGLILYHPDKNINCYTKEIKEKYTTHLVSHHIVITYRKTIEDAKKKLDFNPENDYVITEEGDEKIRSDLKTQWEKILKELEEKIKEKRDQLRKQKCKNRKRRSPQEEKEVLLDIEENDKLDDFWKKKQEEVIKMRKNPEEEKHKKEIKDLENEIKDLEEKMKDKEFHYNCLWIHYYNRTPKNKLRKILDFLDNPFQIVDKKDPVIAGLIENKKE